MLCFVGIRLRKCLYQLVILRNCETQCFVARDENGKVTQGCGICPSNSRSKDCVNCNERYCNEERLVPKQCWINDEEICKTEYDTPCFTERTLANQSLEIVFF
uniref:Uncharacterized protein n=1 Tax=Meloidogyne enterolobii TaxID=390850 RepID=A0A6V7WUS8_MELEN|nr:unnamed protein product [Meloidogyne enterolobii]